MAVVAQGTTLAVLNKGVGRLLMQSQTFIAKMKEPYYTPGTTVVPWDLVMKFVKVCAYADAGAVMVS